MDPEGIDLEAWLQSEDEATRQYRVERLKLLVEEFDSDADCMAFHGGVLSKRYFEEARWSWVNGQFIACTLICQCFVEVSLRSLLAARGQSVGCTDQWLERAGMHDLTEKAQEVGLLMDDDVKALKRLRKNRTQYVHARPAFSKGHFMRRVLSTNQVPEEACEQDAREAVKLIFQIARRFGEIV